MQKCQNFECRLTAEVMSSLPIWLQIIIALTGEVYLEHFRHIGGKKNAPREIDQECLSCQKWCLNKPVAIFDFVLNLIDFK